LHEPHCIDGYPINLKEFKENLQVCAIAGVLMTGKVKLSLCLTKYHAMKRYGGVEE
jgi:hypothetical protein